MNESPVLLNIDANTRIATITLNRPKPAECLESRTDRGRDAHC